eukprot:5084535-Amphidinium_carterae.1
MQQGYDPAVFLKWYANMHGLDLDACWAQFSGAEAEGIAGNLPQPVTDPQGSAWADWPRLRLEVTE